MSVTIKDHRKYSEAKLKQVTDASEKKLLEQEAISNDTGDANLDKLARAVMALKLKSEDHAKGVALKGIGCVQDDMLKLQQFEYFYTKGRIDFADEVLKLPAVILFESKSNTPSAEA